MTRHHFDRNLSLRIDAIIAAIQAAEAWPDGVTKQLVLAVLRARLAVLERQVPG